MAFAFYRKFLPVILMGVSALLAGCNDAPSSGLSNTTSGAPDKTAATQVSMAALAAQAKGFTAGSTMSARTIYVFFDAQCSHCGALWQAVKPLKSQAKFVWIPVGLLGPASIAQGAALLAANDPVATMDQHEASLQARQGGISALGNLDTQKAAVASNTKLMTSFGFNSVPVIVATHAQTGALVTQEGAMPTPALANLMGLQVPASVAN